MPIASYFQPNQLKRVDKPALPVLAVREALVNAICHRDYSDRSGYISIAVFDDRVEIWNNGSLPDQLKITDLKRKHDSILRNKIIAKIFYLRGYIEAWGTGTTKMIDLCQQENIPTPTFSERTGGLVITFKFAKLIGKTKTIEKPKLKKRQKEIIHLLSESPLNSAQITEQLKDPASRRIVQLHLVQLEEAGIIRREGKSRSLIWHLVTT